jgi:hypothetical protein
MVINHSKKTNNCRAARKLIIVEANVQWWRQQMLKLINQTQLENISFSPSMEVLRIKKGNFEVMHLKTKD